MASLESKIRSKFKDDLQAVDFSNNLRLYYGHYPHCIMLTSPANLRYTRPYEDSMMHRYRAGFFSLKRLLKRKIGAHKQAIRMEFDTMRIYTTDPMEVLSLISESKLFVGDDTKISSAITKIELMDPACHAKLTAPVTDSIKTKNVMAKQLPWKKYRYKVYWAAMSRDKRQIGLDNLQAIAIQLQNFEQIRMPSQVIKEIMDKQFYTSWQGTYFYAEDLDWLPIICLIDGRFIKKIERFQTEDELRQEQGII